MTRRRSAIRSDRIALGLSQVDMARIVGVHAMTVSKWERGELVPAPFCKELLTELHVVAKNDPMAGEKIRKALHADGVAGALRVLLNASHAAKKTSKA